ncbi:diacylglycerol kinase [Candidatus Saccharibacteria bacterium]|jgi:diacylglycerol kinase (ATP)|nr:diacylglycerol kinase [Candidatus Saccharibacteria bacterium]
MVALSSFKYAIRGLKEVIKSERNAKIHLFLAFLAIVSSIILRVGVLEFLFVFLSIVLVIFAEIVNTAIEKTLDLISQENNHAIQITKDMMAAAVLLTAIGAIVVAGIVFIPRIIEIIRPFVK